MSRLNLPLALLASALLAWWALFPATLDASGLASLSRAAQARPPGSRATQALARLATTESFGLFPKSDPAHTAAPPAGGELVLKGLSASPGRRAALIAASGAAPQWLVMGHPTAGLELMEWRPDGAVVRLSSGETVTLRLFAAPKAALEDLGSGNAHAPG